MGPAVIKDRAILEKFLREGAPAKLEYIKRYEIRKTATAELKQSPPVRLKVEPEAFRTLMDSAAREKAVLTVGEVEVPPKQDVFVRVFINKPDASAETPFEDPHYAGSFAFFCCAEDKEHAGMAASPTPKLNYLVDLTDTIRKLNQGGSLPADMDVTLVAVPFEKRPVETQRVTLGRLEVGVARF
jgi:tyrosinase